MPHPITRCAAVLVACLSLIATQPIDALVLHPSGDGVITFKPADAVVGQWLGTNQASVVAITPDYVITTKHQGGGVGTHIDIGGTTYEAAVITNHPTADLRVVKVTQLGGAPAGLTDYVDVYNQTDEVGQTAVLGGYGEGRGSAIGSNGFNWAGAGSRTLRWGANIIDSTGTAGSNDVLIADFDSTTYGIAGEATLATGDSGGGYFLWTGSAWEVAALHRAVENPGQAIYWPAPEKLDGVRLSSYSTFIDTLTSPPPPIPGDLDGDGDIDGADISGIFAAFNGPGGGMPANPQADLDGDGDVDGIDVSAAFVAYTGPLAPTNVPEPTGAALLLTTLAGLAMRRRRG